MTRAEKRELLESQRDAARRELHRIAVAYTEDGAGTKDQADLEEAALAFAASDRIIRALDEGKAACLQCGGALIPGLNTDFCSLDCEAAYGIDTGTGTCTSEFRGHRCFHSMAMHPEMHEDENGRCWSFAEGAAQ